MAVYYYRLFGSVGSARIPMRVMGIPLDVIQSITKRRIFCFHNLMLRVNNHQSSSENTIQHRKLCAWQTGITLRLEYLTDKSHQIHYLDQTRDLNNSWNQGHQKPLLLLLIGQVRITLSDEIIFRMRVPQSKCSRLWSRGDCSRF